MIAAVLAATGLLVCAGCGPDSEAEESAAPQSASYVEGRTLYSGEGYPISWIKEPPQTVQELVNRSDAAVVGTVSSVSGPVEELPYDKTESDFTPEERPQYIIGVAYYDIELEEVLLDDGIVQDFPRLRLSGAHNSDRPQQGERFVFTLARNPDNRSYGIMADWMVLSTIDGVRNFDGSIPPYDGITDEAALLNAIRTASANHQRSPFSDWPNKP